MKNQYLGDIGDYGKYGLLRFLSGKGIKIGVNWYLTKNDGTNDGKFKDYLERSMESWMADKKLFTELQRISKENPQSVNLVEDYDLIPGAEYYSERLDYMGLTPVERVDFRDNWFNKSLEILQGADLIFADPDNGISYRAKKTTKNNEKYIIPSEVEKYYKKGQDVVFYCHKGRRKEADWIKVRTKLKEYVPDAHIITLTHHKGTQRSYVFVIHPKRYKKYVKMLKEFRGKPWGEKFTMEPVCYSVAEFQTAYPTKEDREDALQSMNNEQIDQLISTSSVVQGKIYYHSFKKENLN